MAVKMERERRERERERENIVLVRHRCLDVEITDNGLVGHGSQNTVYRHHRGSLKTPVIHTSVVDALLHWYISDDLLYSGHPCTYLFCKSNLLS